MSEPEWLPRPVIEEIHAEQLARHGGAAGLRDPALLDSALARPLNAWSYGENDLCELAALLAEGIARNHPFVDGNKRTGFMAGYTFLRANGLRLRAGNREAADKMLGLAAGTLAREDFADWLRTRVRPV